MGANFMEFVSVKTLVVCTGELLPQKSLPIHYVCTNIVPSQSVSYQINLLGHW